MLILLLGEKLKFKTQGEELLENILARLSLPSNSVQTFYCYFANPPSRIDDRARLRDTRRKELFDFWFSDCSNLPIIVGMGWMPCDLLFYVGKSRMRSRIGCKWEIEDLVDRWAWLTFDPAAALFDPNLVVDITGTIVTAAKEAGHLITINKQVKPYHWKNLS